MLILSLPLSSHADNLLESRSSSLCAFLSVPLSLCIMLAVMMIPLLAPKGGAGVYNLAHCESKLLPESQSLSD